jgi:hypothetical protein
MLAARRRRQIAAKGRNPALLGEKSETGRVLE